MKILFQNKTAESQFSSKYKAKQRYPDAVKKKLEAAENFIIAASTLQDIVNYLPFHFHKLKGDLKGEWSIYLGTTGYRVTMIPCDENGKKILEGDILARCRTIRIVCVTEVSNHYE